MSENPVAMESRAQILDRRQNLVEIKDLVKYFPVRGGLLQRTVAQVQAVDRVSFTIREGETLGLVGESGCGKTTIGRTMLRLIEPTSGEVRFDGVDILKLRGRELKAMRRNMQIIFQDPYASLDPRIPVGESIAEGLRIHQSWDAPAAGRDCDGHAAQGGHGRILCPPLST